MAKVCTSPAGRHTDTKRQERASTEKAVRKRKARLDIDRSDPSKSKKRERQKVSI